MTENPDETALDDVMETAEAAPRDRQEHGKAPDRVDDDMLERRTEQERVQAGLDDYDPEAVPPATE